MMANRGLVERKLVSDFADTERGRLLHEQLKHPQPCWVSDCLEALRQGSQALRMVERNLGRWRAARGLCLTS
jgi:hypothetical protein